MKGCAADSGTGDDVSTPPFGPGGELPRFHEPSGSDPVPPAASPVTTSPLAAGALLVCVAAFVLGLVPALGAVLGVLGIVLVALVARRREMTRRTAVGGVLAGIAVIASVTTSVALIAAVAVSGDTADPAPAAEAPAVVEESGEEPEQIEEPAEPSSAPATSAPAEEPTAESTPVEEETTAEEPTAEPTPTEAPAPDRDDYEEIDERELALIVKAPDDHLARQVVLYGTITQLDAATGPCFVRISISHAPQDAWYDYEHNSVGFAGDGESECPVLDPLVADDEVKMWVTIGGSVSYDTQIGGSTTVPAYLIDDVERI